MKQLTFLEALRLARPLIERGSTTFICHALVNVGGSRFTKQIEDQLNGHYTYDDWVYEKHPKTYRKMSRVWGAFQQGRLQWIDNMIAAEIGRTA